MMDSNPVIPRQLSFLTVLALYNIYQRWQESSFPYINVPSLDTWDFLFSRTDREYPDDKVLFVDCDTEHAYTYKDVRDQSIRLGSGLRAQHHWHPGDVLAVFSPNHINYAAVVCGTHWAGGTASLINPTYTASELQFQLLDSNAKLLITHPSLLPIVQPVAKQIGLAEDKIFLMTDDKEGRMAPFMHFSTICSPISLVRPIIDPMNDLSFLIYSSGTTGKPKGVMLTHTNIVANTLMISVANDGNLSWKGGPSGKGDRAIGFLPFFHSYGLQTLLLVGVHTGTETVVMPKFDLEKFCEFTERLKVSYVPAVPPVVLALGKSAVVDKFDLNSIRMISSGAAPLTRDLVNLVSQRLNTPVMQGYGLSETSPVTHQQRWENCMEAIGSIGNLLSNQISKFVTPSGQEVKAGETGELWVKGPNVFKGYLNNPEGTKNAFSSDGYFMTGDVGYQDEKGNVFITDRIKELIKYNGFQVAPAELEGLLMSHPSVADAAVVGVMDDKRASEVPQAYVVTATGVSRNDATAKNIMKWMETKLAHHKKLRGGIIFIDEIPKSAAGKILRNILRAKAREAGTRSGRSKL